MLDKIKFAKMIRALAILIPKFAPKFEDEYAVSLWYAAFEGFDENKMAEVFGMCRDNFTEFPSIKDIKELYKGIGGKEPKRIEEINPSAEVLRIISSIPTIKEIQNGN